MTPISRSFGWDRGTPIDRYYIERFLGLHGEAGDIHGRVLEVGDDAYMRRFGPLALVTSVDVLDIDDSNVHATLVLDLGTPQKLDQRFDCIICTQTLLHVYDVHAAVDNLFQLLTPGGILLVTVPGISQICRPEVERFGDWWRFTSTSVRRLLTDVFGDGNVDLETHGNVMTAAAFLYGCSTADLRGRELDHRDPDYEVTICARAVKATAGC